MNSTKALWRQSQPPSSSVSPTTRNSFESGRRRRPSRREAKPAADRERTRCHKTFSYHHNSTPHRQGGIVFGQMSSCFPFRFLSCMKNICSYQFFVVFLHLVNQLQIIVADTKYIFVTGGVVSSLGKGIISASIGKLLQARGYNITIQKLLRCSPRSPCSLRKRPDRYSATPMPE